MSKKNLPDLIDTSFVDKIGKDKVRKLIYIIRSEMTRGRADNDICSMLAITPAQLNMIRNHPLFFDTYQETIIEDNDEGDIIRQVLKAKQVQYAQTLADMAVSGDKEAMKLYAKIMGADRPKRQQDISGLSYLVSFLESCGFTSREIENARKIKELKSDAIETTAVPMIDDATAKEVGYADPELDKLDENVGVSTSLLDSIEPVEGIEDIAPKTNFSKKEEIDDELLDLELDLDDGPEDSD